MKRRVLLTVVVVMAILNIARAQTKQLKITGHLTDFTNKEPLPNAAVALLEGKDSVVAFTVVADAKGFFTITGTKPGNYLLVVSYMGYQQLTRQIHVQDTSRLIALGTLTLKRKGLMLNEVEIVDIRPPITIKEDTIEYNAGSFKTRENALLEELLKKLPGIKVEKDGTIKANGETVKKITVDGKPFFGNDPKMATRNLPADIIDKVQLIDKKSDQAQFTGIADGETEKTLNFTVKADRKKGVFGRGSVGYGNDERFSVDASMNRFRKTEQLSILAGGNNINNTSFSFSDGFGFGGGAKGGSGGGGLSRNWFGGLNYSDNLAKGLRLSGSYFISDMKRESESRRERENRHKPDSFSYVNAKAGSLSNNRSHRMNVRLEYDMDSSHSLILSPNISYNSGDDLSESRTTTLNNSRDTVNNGRQLNKTTATSPNINGTALFRKKFDKKGRTFSTNFNFGFNSNNRESINQSQTAYRERNGSFTKDTIDQKVIQENSSNNLGMRMSYTEPVFIDRFLELNYGYSRNFNSSDRRTYDKGKLNGKYDELNDSLTNSFRNVYSNHQAGISLMTQKLRYNYTLGINLQFNNLESRNLTKDNVLRQHTTNISPLANLNYNFSRNRRMRISYRGQTQQPSLEQLQPVPDNTNPLFVKLGNPDLKPTFNNNVSLNYNDFNPVSMRSFFASVTGSVTLNKIVNSTEITDKGVQIIKPVNVNGTYNVNAYMVNGFPLNKQQRTAINTNTYMGLNRDVSFLNKGKNYTQTLNITQAASFNYSFKELFDVAAGGNVNYNRVRFSNNKENNTNYFNYGLSLDFNLNLPLGIIMGADVDYTANSGRNEGYNLQYTLANAFVSKSLFKAKQGLIKFQVFDLFNQNVSVNRTVMDNYTEDAETKVLQRYFLISFSYFLNRFGGKGSKGKADGMMMNSMPAPPVRF